MHGTSTTIRETIKGPKVITGRNVAHSRRAPVTRAFLVPTSWQAGPYSNSQRHNSWPQSPACRYLTCGRLSRWRPIRGSVGWL